MEDRALREAAPLIDRRLAQCPYQTLVHGDAKLANFRFRADAATACITREAGGWVSNAFGQPLDFNQTASTFMHEQGVVYASSEGVGRLLVRITPELPGQV